MKKYTKITTGVLLLIGMLSLATFVIGANNPTTDDDITVQRLVSEGENVGLYIFSSNRPSNTIGTEPQSAIQRIGKSLGLTNDEVIIQNISQSSFDQIDFDEEITPYFKEYRTDSEGNIVIFCEDTSDPNNCYVEYAYPSMEKEYDYSSDPIHPEFTGRYLTYVKEAEVYFDKSTFYNYNIQYGSEEASDYFQNQMDIRTDSKIRENRDIMVTWQNDLPRDITSIAWSIDWDGYYVQE